LINLIDNKLRTPKNITFNKLIEFLNNKYSLSIESSTLDTSNILNNSWLSGFTEAGKLRIRLIKSNMNKKENK